MAKRRPHGTGSIFRPKSKGADGEMHEQHVYWIAYRVEGKLIRESADTTVKTEAETLLRARMAAVDAGTVTVKSRATTLADLRKLVEDDYENNGRRSLDKTKRTFNALEAYFGADRKASTIDLSAIEAYKSARLKTKAPRSKTKTKPATVNRELASLRRGFRLAVKHGKLAKRPDFSMLQENNARRGFFEADQVGSLLKHAPDWLASLVVFLSFTGWRRREATRLEWRQVDRNAQVIRIEETKTGDPRTIPYGAIPQLVTVIETQWKRAKAERKAGKIVPWVFHREGGEIRDFRETWKSACKAAGLAGRIPHDFRRTAARNMLRAGIPQAVAMIIGGWKTDSVFRRYAIVDEKLIAENLAKLAAK